MAGFLGGNSGRGRDVLGSDPFLLEKFGLIAGFDEEPKSNECLGLNPVPSSGTFGRRPPLTLIV